MHQDGITETITHFIGLFASAEEDARLRHDYDKFERTGDRSAEPSLPMPAHPVPRQALELAPNHPLVRYQPEEASTPNSYRAEPFHPPSPFIQQVSFTLSDPPNAVLPEGAGGRSGHGFVSHEGPIPGSVAMLAVQAIDLTDNDVIVIGDISGPLPDYAPDTSGVEAMLAEIAVFSGALADRTPSGLFHAIPEFMAAASDAAYAMANDKETSVVATTAIGPATKGMHLDGETVADLPSLDEAMPDIAQDDITVTTGSVSLTTGDNTMQVATGQNQLTNEASILDASIAPPIVAVAGDHVRLDVISQINAFSDADKLDGAFQSGVTSQGNTAHNLAEFTSILTSSSSSTTPADIEAMPANWTVSVFEGDLVFLEWISQYTFSTDNDLMVLTATGATTNIESGGNIGFNDASFSNLGLFYDIVIIGGDLYETNIVSQANVLYDNDTLQMLDAAGISASATTSDNLLWNQASITRYGPEAALGPLPAHYMDAMELLESGARAMPEGFGKDPLLAGLDHLRVLYVTGSIYDLHVVQQTNVLADADHVAVYARGLLEHPDSAWEISTGQNALVNLASITDYASSGDTLYVNGGTYSDAILVQADLVGTAGPANGNFASELVAFLDTETALQPILEHHAALSATFDATPAPADVMQSVLA